MGSVGEEGPHATWGSAKPTRGCRGGQICTPPGLGLRGARAQQGAGSCPGGTSCCHPGSQTSHLRTKKHPPPPPTEGCSFIRCGPFSGAKWPVWTGGPAMRKVSLTSSPCDQPVALVSGARSRSCRLRPSTRGQARFPQQDAPAPAPGHRPSSRRSSAYRRCQRNTCGA